MQVILVYKPIDCKQIFIILVKSITTTLALTSEQIDKTHLGLFQLHILLLGQTFSGWILIIIKFFKKIVSWDNSPKAFGSWTPCGRLGEEVLSRIVNNLQKLSKCVWIGYICQNRLKSGTWRRSGRGHHGGWSFGLQQAVAALLWILVTAMTILVY